MAVFTKQTLSGSTDGAPITITSNSSETPVTIHTASSTSDVMDEIYLYTVNNSTSDATLTFNFGGTNIVVPVAAGVGLIAQIPGLLLQNGKTVTGFANITGVVQVMGFVNRITR